MLVFPKYQILTITDPQQPSADETSGDEDDSEESEED
jgi:hypothetical protein